MICDDTFLSNVVTKASLAYFSHNISDSVLNVLALLRILAWKSQQTTL